MQYKNSAITGNRSIRAAGAVIAETHAASELVEGDHPTVIYFPRNNIAMAFLNYTDKTSHCIHKGYARYFLIITKNKPIENVAWTYENPKIEMAMAKDHLVFYSNDTIIIEHL